MSSAIHLCDNVSKRRGTTWQIFVDMTRDAISGDICMMGNTHQKMDLLPDECKIALPSQGREATKAENKDNDDVPLVPAEPKKKPARPPPESNFNIEDWKRAC